MKYTMKPLTVRPGKHVVSWIIYSPEGEYMVAIKKKEDAAKVLAHLNREEYVPEDTNVRYIRSKV